MATASRSTTRSRSILLDEGRPDYLGGQFVHAAVASLDWGGMVDFFRTGEPIRSRPDRYRVAIERLTAQDIAVFFQEALAALPQLVADLARGGRVADVHCGGGRWLIAMARRFPELELIGVEFEADSVVRARANVEAAGLTDRITIRQAGVTDPGEVGEFDLIYFQYALHQLPDAPRVLAVAWQALRPGGRLIVLDWPLPSERDEFRTRHGELIAGVQLDELYQGTALATREQFLAWFAEAGLPTPATDRPAVGRVAVRRRTALKARGQARPIGRARSIAQLTTIVPFIWVGWIEQWNGYVPATVKVRPSLLVGSMVGRLARSVVERRRVWARRTGVREGDDVADLGRDRGGIEPEVDDRNRDGAGGRGLRAGTRRARRRARGRGGRAAGRGRRSRCSMSSRRAR